MLPPCAVHSGVEAKTLSPVCNEIYIITRILTARSEMPSAAITFSIFLSKCVPLLRQWETLKLSGPQLVSWRPSGLVAGTKEITGRQLTARHVCILLFLLLYHRFHTHICVVYYRQQSGVASLRKLMIIMMA
jgi:hypothetical protein